jgi:predicted membrane-bound spermidine synthase
VIIADGRVGLERSQKRYQIISVDAYRPPYIPWHMTTVEFFQLAYDHLTPDGVLAINVGRAPLDRRMVDALYSTIRAVFPSAYIVDIPDTFNSVIFATAAPGDLTGLAANYERLSKDPNTPTLLMETLQRTVTSLQPTPGKAQVFTDDIAPVEWLTNAMVLNFFFSGQMETLQ